jgi:hypothetical protein
MWIGGGHPYKECLEMGNTASIPTCCRLMDREEPHPSTIEGAGTPRKKYERGSRRESGKGVLLFQSHYLGTIFRGDAT